MNDKILILQYLCWAKAVPPRNRWLSFLELPAGEHHYAPLQKKAIFPLAEKYGDNLKAFRRKGDRWGVSYDAGDASYLVQVFPLIKVAVVLWSGDEEFSPRATILFDSSSPLHLPTDSLYVMAIRVVQRIWEI